MVISKLKRLYSKDETVPDEGETSTAVSVYEPKSISSARRRQSADYQKSREYRGSNLSSGSRRLASESQRKSADNTIDAKFEDVNETYSSKLTQDSTGSRKLKDILHDEPSVQEEVPTQKSQKKHVVDAKDPTESDARDDAEYSIGMKKAKTRGKRRGLNLEDIEEDAYQEELNRRDAEKLKKDVKKAQERGINRATPFPEKIAKAEKAAGKAIGEGLKEIDKATATFAKSHMGKNITKANEATLRGMQEAGERAHGSIVGGRANITRSALNKPRAFGSSSSTNQDLKITTRIVRRGRNDVVLYFDQYGRQISAAAARAYMAGKVPMQKPLANLNQHATAPFALGRPKTLLADLQNHGIPFALGSHQASFVGGTHEAPFAPGRYNAPFAVNSKPTLVVGGYRGNPLGDVRWVSGNPLGNMVRVSDPIGMIRKEGNPLGDDERRGHTSRILRGQVKKEGSPLGNSEKAGHTSRMVRANRRSKKPVTKSASKKKI
ncbi:hypothetical protein FXW07_07170 [Methanosarcina sp. DH1]|uniref:hypothetical protein n=1 Tax=Methanosarcina sp. DH1 TaxID=2605695 RepID=UPI001E32F4F2|nr:hypothetical protein [Methanosarcina sp. DH1]MCC4766400.1 hypothetical protein [Methanosarcina sp. DH1]